MKYFLMKPKTKKYECHLHCLQFDHTCIFYLFGRFLSRHWDNKMSDGEKILYGASKHFYHHCFVLWPLLHRLFRMGTERGKDSVLYFQLASVTFAENNINKKRRIGYGYLFKETFYKHCCFMRLYCWIIVGYYRT